jgi:hypothetical protein
MFASKHPASCSLTINAFFTDCAPIRLHIRSEYSRRFRTQKGSGALLDAGWETGDGQSHRACVAFIDDGVAGKRDLYGTTIKRVIEH